MKIRYYMDLWPGCDPLRYPPMVMAVPGEKSPNTLRFALDIEVPDHLLFQTDGVLPEVVRGVVVGERE